MNGNSTVDGVRAVELFYRPIKNTDSGRVTFLQSQTRLNSPAMGTLMPADYLPVAQLSNRCVSIFKLALVQLLQALGKRVHACKIFKADGSSESCGRLLR
ncbi:hypothetical protein [Ruminococcus sp.]|uniref:hypothetical protein n=1 Tax=Ruminococcus sp. TaxID=41978 RepID=UPI00257FB929|nr:hypothetical protein [Ruminococcus sp.]